MRSRLFALAITALISVGAVLGDASAAWAQDALRIAAVVNDEVISVYDLVTRTHLAIVSSGLPDTPETRQRLQPQVLRALIDEKIQVQEATRQNITATDADMKAAIEQIERNNRMQSGGLEEFIHRTGIERSAIMAQIRATILWQKLITRRLRATTQVGEDEVDEQMAQLRAAQGEPEVLLSEIFLAVDAPEQEEQVRQASTGIVEQIRNGVPFNDIARQFSQSASAATGGDIGWVRMSTLEKEIAAAVARTSPGQITEPVRAIGGYYIYAVRQQRSGASGSGDEARITLAQFLLPIGSVDTEARMKAAEKVRNSASGCEDLGRLAKELGAPPPTKAERLRLSDLAPQIRPLVAPLRSGEISAPVETDQGLLFLMVCERETPRAPLPTREQVAESLSRQRLDLQARRYLRDLRRTAFIDVRI